VQNVIVTLHGLFDYGDGVAARIESSQKSTFRMDCEVVLEHGVLTLPQYLMNRARENGPLPWRETTGTWVESQETVEVPTQFENPYGLQMMNLARQLREGTSPGVPIEETLDNLYTIDALVHAYEENCWVGVEHK
jgi:predicted dehydrogenase